MFDGRLVYSVSGFAREVKQLLESSYPDLWIEGEITNLSTPASGHSYFSLKDDRAQLRCALFRQKKLRCTTAPRVGAQVLVRARVSIYEARGDFQLIVDYMEDAGEGALRRAMEALKRQLLEEGLFSPERKKPLPAVPRSLGVVTSSTGAALRDILITLRRIVPWLPVIVYPVPVQGDAAAPAIVDALRRAAARAECDALILARGGGSLEDLQAFNDESVARAVFASPIPVVSGVGHETDTTIVDFVADARAATPTAAAQLVGGAGERLTASLERLSGELARAMDSALGRRTQDVDRLTARMRHPLERIRHQIARVDQLGARLRACVTRRASLARRDLAASEARLRQASPLRPIRQHVNTVDERRLRIKARLRARLAMEQARVDGVARQLQQLSPKHTLARGYAILVDANDGAVIDRVDKARADQSLTGRLFDGSLDLRVLDSRKD
ncbi:MAG: exodeoxyribonuclease VII large subunit [Proteobacteria bacterium]|nr:MAG: exodeoxyribonuclease VII large subunit [Pseudomonadota bacterium]